MAADWPTLAIIDRGSYTVTWRGVLTPCQTDYEIEIQYAAAAPPKVISLRDNVPRVRVLAPDLEPRPEAPRVPVPHVYHREQGMELCIFDPVKEEWSGEDLIAETTVPWTLRWLFRYEGWRVTGHWFGKGRAHGPTGRFHPDDGTPLRWRDRWASTTTELVYWEALSHSFDRRRRHQGAFSYFRFDRFRTEPVRGPLGRRAF